MAQTKTATKTKATEQKKTKETVQKPNYDPVVVTEDGDVITIAWNPNDRSGSYHVKVYTKGERHSIDLYRGDSKRFPKSGTYVLMGHYSCSRFVWTKTLTYED